jgi:hypothetical protein
MSVCPTDFLHLSLCPVAETYVRLDQGMSAMPWLLSVILLTIDWLEDKRRNE